MREQIISTLLMGVPALAVLAEMTTANLTPLEGWTATGLLAAVLSWVLLQHLPRKDREMDQLAIRKDDQIRDLMAQHEKHLADQGLRYEASLARVTEHCEKEMAELVNQLRAERHRSEHRTEGG